MHETMIISSNFEVSKSVPSGLVGPNGRDGQTDGGRTTSFRNGPCWDGGIKVSGKQHMVARSSECR